VLQGRLSGKAVVDDPAADAIGEGGVAEDRLVNREDRGRLTTYLSLDLLLQCLELAADPVASGLVPSELGCDFTVLQPLGIRIDVDLVNAISRPDRHTRGYCDAFAHASN